MKWKIGDYFLLITKNNKEIGLITKINKEIIFYKMIYSYPLFESRENIMGNKWSIAKKRILDGKINPPYRDMKKITKEEIMLEIL